jgi:hypothetical protein
LSLTVVSFTSDVIQILVGSDPPVRFRVHKDLICNSSAFFKSALSHDWKEAEEQTVRLEEDDLEIFKLYIHWLYRGTVFEFSENGYDYGTGQYWSAAKAYVLGDKLQDGNFCDAAIDVFIDGLQQADYQDSDIEDMCVGWPYPGIVPYIYENTPEVSKIRQLMVDIFVYKGDSCWLPETSAPAFVRSVAVRLLKITDGHEAKRIPSKDSTLANITDTDLIPSFAINKGPKNGAGWRRRCANVLCYGRKLSGDRHRT